MDRQQLWRVGKVAKYLDLSEGRVYELARQGVIPAVRIGRQLRFLPSAIFEFAENGGQALPGGWRREA